MWTDNDKDDASDVAGNDSDGLKLDHSIFEEVAENACVNSDASDAENQDHSELVSEESDVDIDDQWQAYSVDKADPLCYKFDDLL